MSQLPLVSVVMTVFNAEPFVAEAIKSILDQTYQNFEFIIIDDGSTDNSFRIIKSFNDKRIIWKSRENQGVPKSSNEGVKMARGKYIARQDADDLSEPKRLEKQVRFLENNPSIDMVGTNYKAMRLNGEVAFTSDMLTRPDDLKLATVFTNQFGHGSVMMKKSVLIKVGGYREISIVHDYDLWTRINLVSNMANLPETLYTWRYHDNSLSNKNFESTMQQVRSVHNDAFAHFKDNRKLYPLHSWHPASTNSFFKYQEEKSRVFRDMALMYCYDGLRRRAAPALMRAILYAPWADKNYKYLFIVLFNKQAIQNLHYE